VKDINMPQSTSDILNQKIDEDAFKTYALFKQQQKVTAADFLNKFPVENHIHIRYRTIKFSGYALIRAILLQGIKGIKFQTQLHKYLEENQKERNKIGLQDAPNQRTLNHFIIIFLTKQQKKH